MPVINDPNVTSQIAQVIRGGSVNSDDIIRILNSSLPSGFKIQTTADVSSGVYKRFNEFDKVNAKVEIVTTGLWTGDSGTLSGFYTGSTQVASSGDYYWNVYESTGSNNEIQFALAYGHFHGSGSVSLSSDPDSLLPSKATYSQYRSALLDPDDAKFSFENNSNIAVDSNSIYAINVSRARYREKMDPGNWELHLSGSNGLYKFIDDSEQKYSNLVGKAGRVFKIVSGSINLGTSSEATVNSTTSPSGYGYGLFYPDRGILILNPTAIDDTIGDIHGMDGTLLGDLIGDLSTDDEYQNHGRLFWSIVKGENFQARRVENISTQHFFVRATNREFNFSNNPTYTNSDGTFIHSEFDIDPKTYITTIGLYNDSNELIAVAKTSQPIPKSFDKEVLIKIRLSF